MRRLFDDLRTRMDHNSVDAAYLRRSDARSLAVALVDTIMCGNFERVLDTLQASSPRLCYATLRIWAAKLQGGWARSLQCWPAANTAALAEYLLVISVALLS